MTDKPVTILLVGAGNRGRGVFGQYAIDMPHKCQFVAVVEPDQDKRETFANTHKINPQNCFSSLEKLKENGKIAQAMIIATHESERIEYIRYGTEKGYDILCEKPLCQTIEQAIIINDIAVNYGNLFMVCHQMRYIPAYDTIKKLINSGRFGNLISIQHSENLSYHHMAHSFVRGFFNNDSLTPMIISKSCHDMDILCYFADSKPTKVCSFGQLVFFKSENAPLGAKDYCLDGCTAKSCPYNVLKIYFNADTDPAYIRQMGIVKDKQHLYQLLRTNRFGRCVFKCDNNVVDSQSLAIEFSNGINCVFQVVGHNFHERRITKLSMTNGEIFYDFTNKCIKAYTFEPLQEQEIIPAIPPGSHYGGDFKIMEDFIESIQKRNAHPLTSVSKSFDSHLLGFAAEHSRKTNQTIDLEKYEKEIRANVYKLDK